MSAISLHHISFQEREYATGECSVCTEEAGRHPLVGHWHRSSASGETLHWNHLSCFQNYLDETPRPPRSLCCAALLLSSPLVPEPIPEEPIFDFGYSRLLAICLIAGSALLATYYYPWTVLTVIAITLRFSDGNGPLDRALHVYGAALLAFLYMR